MGKIYWNLHSVGREGNGTPLQYSCLENPMDGGAWWAAVHGVAKNRTRQNDFTFTFLHWRRKGQPIPVFLPGESQGQGSLVGCCLWGPTVRHNWSNLAAAATGSIWYKNIQNTWFFKVLYIYIYTHTHVWGGGAQYATGDQWRNNSKKMKGWSQSKNNMQLWMWLVMEARSDAVKSNTA